MYRNLYRRRKTEIDIMLAMIAEKFRYGLTSFFLIIITVISVLFTVMNVFIDGYTIAYVQDIRFIYGGSLLAIAVILLFLFTIRPVTTWLNQHHRISKPLYYLIIFLICFILISYANPLRTDAALCFDFASNFNGIIEGTLENLNYLERFPYNLSMVFIDRLFQVIFGGHAIFALRLLNILMVLLTIWSLDQLVCLYHGSLVGWYFKWFAIFWTPIYFLCALVYGWLYGLGCISFALYCYLRFVKTNKDPLFLLIAVVFAILAIFFKLNFAIVIIAAILAVVVSAKIPKKYLHFLTLILVLLLGLNLPKQVGSIAFGFDKTKEMPVTTYFVMANYRNNELPIGKNLYLDGWVDGTHTALYERFQNEGSDNIHQDLSKFNKESLKNQFMEAINHPLDAIKFYGHKLISTWFVQDYGMFNEYNVDMTNESSINNVGIRIALISSKIASLLTFIGLCLYCLIYWLNYKHWNILDLLLGITFIGFVAYYLIGEAQSRYVIVSVLMVMPLSACGVYELDTFTLKLKESKPFRYITLVAFVIFIGFHFCLRFQSIQTMVYPMHDTDNATILSINEEGFGNSLNFSKPEKSIDQIELLMGDDYTNGSFELIIYDQSGSVASYNRYSDIDAYGYTPLRLSIQPFDWNDSGYTIYIKPLDSMGIPMLINEDQQMLISLYAKRKTYLNIRHLPYIPSNNFPF